MDSAVRLGMGERIALIPQLADPKNLFGMLARGDDRNRAVQRTMALID